MEINDYQKRLVEIREEKKKLDPLRPQFCKKATDWVELEQWWNLSKEENDIENKLWDVEKYIEENTLSTPLSEYEAIEKLNDDEDKDKV
jgi:hypothetical protein